MDVPLWADQWKCIHISSVRTQNVVLKTSRDDRNVWREGKSGKSMLSEQIDDDDDDDDE